jgi:hypothetical protein
VQVGRRSPSQASVGTPEEMDWFAKVFASEGSSEDIYDEADVGLAVIVEGYEDLSAYIRFVGDYHVTETQRIGVELSAPRGRHDGTVRAPLHHLLYHVAISFCANSTSSRMSFRHHLLCHFSACLPTFKRINPPGLPTADHVEPLFRCHAPSFCSRTELVPLTHSKRPHLRRASC